jgi:WD40 repeat protein
MLQTSRIPNLLILLALGLLAACTPQPPASVPITIPAATQERTLAKPLDTETPELHLTPTAPIEISVTNPPGGEPACLTPRDLLSFAFTPDSVSLLVRGNGGVQIFNLTDLQEAGYIESLKPIITAALSPDGKILAWSLDDHTIQLVRVADQQVLHTLSGHTDLVTKLRFSPDGDLLISASHDRWVRVWDMQGEELRAFQPQGEVLGIGISPDGRALATVLFDGPVKLWNLETLEIIKDIGGTGGFDTSDAYFSPDGQLLAADLASGLYLWRISDGSLVWDEPINSMAVAFSPDGRYLAYADIADQYRIKLITSDGSQVLYTIDSGHLGAVWELFFSPDSQLLLSIDGGEIRIWNVADGSLRYIGKAACPSGPGTPEPPSSIPTPTICLDEAAQALPVSPRQTPLEVRFLDNGNLWVWQEDAPKAVQISSTRDVQSFYFSPDGQVIAFTRGKPFGQIELWAINRDGTDLRRLVSADQLHAMVGEPTITDIEFTDDIGYISWIDGGRTLGFAVQRAYNALGGPDESSGAWQIDLETGQLSPWEPPLEIQNQQAGLVSPDGGQVALVGETGLTLVNADGTDRRKDRLTYPYIPQVEGGGFIAPVVVWTADSQALAAITYSENVWEAGATFTTWRVPIDVDPAYKLHTFSGFPLSVYLSPDQQYLAYRSPIAPISKDWELHLATFDGSRDIVYARGQVMDFWGWAPDGVHFVFGQDETRSLYLGSLCGAPQPLLDPPVAPIWHFTWVDPQRFVFMSGGDGATGRELRLGTVGDGSLLLGPLDGDYATYQIKPD